MEKSRSYPLAFGFVFLGFCTVAAAIVGLIFWPDSPSTPTATALPAALPSLDISPSPLPAEPTAFAGATIDPTAFPTPDDSSAPAGQIAFTCFVGGFDQICRVNADGTGREQLTTGDATHFYPSLTPDGGSILYATRTPELVFEIFAYDLETSAITQLTHGIGNLFAPELSPDRSTIIFTRASDNHQTLWLVDSSGNNPRLLTDSAADDIDPTWSPDGTLIAFASSRSGARQLYVMDADGTNIRQLTQLPDMGGRSTWSPDGTRLAFYAGLAGGHNIFAINLDGTGLTQLTFGGDNLGPSWSPDGNWIAFTSFRDGNNEIYLIRPDGSGITRLTDNPISDWQPRWGPALQGP